MNSRINFRPSVFCQKNIVLSRKMYTLSISLKKKHENENKNDIIFLCTVEVYGDMYLFFCSGVLTKRWKMAVFQLNNKEQ